MTRIAVCQRCGKGRAHLAAADGSALSIPLDPARVRELSAGPTSAGEVHWLSELVLAQMTATGAAPSEVVLDLDGGRLRALLSLTRAGEPDVIACTPQEGLALALRAGVALYATDEALAAAATRPGTGGTETIH